MVREIEESEEHTVVPSTKTARPAPAPLKEETVRELTIVDFFDLDSDPALTDIEPKSEFHALLDKVLLVIKDVVFAHTVAFFWANRDKGADDPGIDGDRERSVHDRPQILDRERPGQQGRARGQTAAAGQRVGERRARAAPLLRIARGDPVGHLRSGLLQEHGRRYQAGRRDRGGQQGRRRLRGRDVCDPRPHDQTGVGAHQELHRQVRPAARLGAAELAAADAGPHRVGPRRRRRSCRRSRTRPTGSPRTTRCR